jgi:large subunit ribosomal protein L21
MKYAVIKSGGKQYKVSEGDEILIDKIPVEENKEVLFENTLLFVADDDVKIGKPILSDIKVRGKVVKQGKGKKIKVSKFKSKVRYRKTVGFRAHITTVKIEKIEEGKEKEKTKPKTKAKQSVKK